MFYIHRMGPQFAFKVVNPSTTSLTPSSSALFADVEPFTQGATIATLDDGAACSEPVLGGRAFPTGPAAMGGAAPAHASAGRYDSLMLDVNLESLKLTEESGGRSNPVDMPSIKGRKWIRTLLVVLFRFRFRFSEP